MEDNNLVFVGKKPVMAYVLAVVTQFSKTNNVKIKARGQSISKAVDVVEIVKNKFIPEMKVINIQIGTDILTVENNTINVSRIEIETTK